MGRSSFREFGMVPMPEEIATPEDIASVVKGVEELPAQSVPDDVVQLIGKQSGYQTGAYYQFGAEQKKWIKIEHGTWEIPVPELQATLEAVDDHTHLVLDSGSGTFTVEDSLQIIFRSEVGDVLIGQFHDIKFDPYTITLPKQISYYQGGLFIGRVCKNGYTTDFEIVV